MRTTVLRAATAAAAIAAFTLPATAETFRVGDIVVETPWSRATPGGARVAGGYLAIRNEGTTPDRLVGGSVDVAARFEVHSMAMVDGVARMAPVEGGLEIPPGETVMLEPGGYHVMMMDLRAPLTEGDTITGTLVFETAGTVEITYAVGPLGSREAPMHGHGQGHGHGHGHGHRN